MSDHAIRSPQSAIRNGWSRRNFLRMGGLGLCGVGLLDMVRAQAAATGKPAPLPRAKQMIICWMSGGPPHTDMFDMKPDAPDNCRGEFKPIQTNVTGTQICELMPNLAQMADKYAIIRSVSPHGKATNHDQCPLYWLTGNPRRTTGTEDYPAYGSVLSKLRPGPVDLPRFVQFGSDWYTNNEVGNSFLGPAHAPLVFDPTLTKDAMTAMLTPQHELPDFERNADFLKAIDTRLRRLDGQEPLIEGLDQHQQTAFNMMRSPKLRQAIDLSREPVASLERYTRLSPGKPIAAMGNSLHFLLARRLVEAGVPVVHFGLGNWDWHDNNFPNGRKQIPHFDAGLAALIEDLDQRGLLDTTIVLALGEMGRTPVCGTGKNTGRHHWERAQFVIAAGGGFRGGVLVGATDKVGGNVTDKPYKIESFGRTLYHLLGIDPDTIVTTPANRPIKLIVEDAPLIREAIV